MERNLKLAWCAGYIEENGTVWIDKDGEPALVLRADKNTTGISRFAETLDLEVSKVRYKKIWRIKLSGSGLKLMMQEVWPYLTQDKRNYLRAMFAMAKSMRAGESTDS